MHLLTAGLVVLTGVVLGTGTVVTGSGPHAGAADVRRLGFDPVIATRLHADLVFLLVGFAMACTVSARALGAPAAVRRGTRTVLALLLLQGAVGYAQYYSGVPAYLVLVHVLGAALVFTAACWTYAATTATVPDSPRPAAARAAGVALPGTIGTSAR